MYQVFFFYIQYLGWEDLNHGRSIKKHLEVPVKLHVM